MNPCSGHHIRSPDCHDMSPSVKAFSGLQGRASCFDSFVFRVPLLLACVGVAVSVWTLVVKKLSQTDRLCSGRHGFDTGCSADVR